MHSLTHTHTHYQHNQLSRLSVISLFTVAKYFLSFFLVFLHTNSNLCSSLRVCNSLLQSTFELDMSLLFLVQRISSKLSNNVPSLYGIAKFKYWIPIEKMNKDKSDRSFFCVVCALFFMFVKILQKVFRSSETCRFPTHSLFFYLSPFHAGYCVFVSAFVIRARFVDSILLIRRRKNTERFHLCSFLSLDTLVSVTSI